MSTATKRVTSFLSRPRVTVWAAILNAEVLLTIWYFALAPAIPTDIPHLVYPWLWINASIWAVSRVGFVPTSPRSRYLAVAIGVAYFVLLGYFGGLYNFTGSGLGFRLAWLPPGWGPAPIYSAETFTIAILPFKLIGFAALAYLVAATVVDATASGLAGFIGLFSCVSCTWPLLATVFTGIFGSASAAASIVTGQAYGASTVVFLASVGMLVWRPVR